MRLRSWVVLVLTVLGATWAAPSSACSVCVHRHVVVFGITLNVADECRAARDGEIGRDVCTEVITEGATICSVQGNDCIVVSGGGGGGAGSGGGNGGECTVDQGSVCPPSCGACNRV